MASMQPTPDPVTNPPVWQTRPFWTELVASIGTLLGSIGLIAPGNVVGLDDAVTKIIGAILVLASNVPVLVAYFRPPKVLLLFLCLGALAGLLLPDAAVAADPVHPTGLFFRRPNRANCYPPAAQVVPVAPVVVQPQAAAIDPFAASNAAALQSLALSHQQMVSLLAMGSGGGCLGGRAAPCQPPAAAPAPVVVPPVVVTPPASPAPALPPASPLPQQQIIVVPGGQAPQQNLPVQGAPQQLLPIQGAPQQVLPYQGAPQQVLPYQGAPQILLPLGPNGTPTLPPQQLLPVGPGTAPPQQLLPVAPASVVRPAPQPQRYAVYVVNNRKYVVINRTIYLVVK